MVPVGDGRFRMGQGAARRRGMACTRGWGRGRPRAAPGHRERPGVHAVQYTGPDSRWRRVRQAHRTATGRPLPSPGVGVSGRHRLRLAVAATGIVAGCEGSVDEVSLTPRRGAERARPRPKPRQRSSPSSEDAPSSSPATGSTSSSSSASCATRPARRLTLSASATEPFSTRGRAQRRTPRLAAGGGARGAQDTITRAGAPDLAADDTPRPGAGGPAPDDWIGVDEGAGVVRGTRFQLAATDGSARPLPCPGTLMHLQAPAPRHQRTEAGNGLTRPK